MSLKNWLNRVSNVLRNKNSYLSFQTLLSVIDQSNREESRVIHYKRSVTTQHKRQTRRPIKASITPPCRSRVIHKWCLKGDREGGNHTIDYYRSISHVHCEKDWILLVKPSTKVCRFPSLEAQHYLKWVIWAVKFIQRLILVLSNNVWD